MTTPAFALVCDNAYSILLRSLLRSILKVQPDFNYNFYVICNETLSQKNREQLKKIYNRLIFWNVNAEKYKKVGKIKPNYWSIECFNLPEKKVIQLGADCLLISSVDELVKEEVDIGMPKEKLRSNMFSSGIMIIGEKYLNEKTYNNLINANYDNIEMFGTDMRLYNCFFEDKITEVAYKYDVVDSELGYINFSDIVFLHLIHKPTITWARGGALLSKEVYSLWLEYHCIDYPDGKIKTNDFSSVEVNNEN